MRDQVLRLYPSGDRIGRPTRVGVVRFKEKPTETKVGERATDSILAGLLETQLLLEQEFEKFRQDCYSDRIDISAGYDVLISARGVPSRRLDNVGEVVGQFPGGWSMSQGYDQQDLL